MPDHPHRKNVGVFSEQNSGPSFEIRKTHLRQTLQNDRPEAEPDI